MKVRRTLTTAIAVTLLVTAGTTGPAADAAGDTTVVVPGVAALAALTLSAGVGIGGSDCAAPERWQIGAGPPVVNTSTPGTPLGSAIWALDLQLPGSAWGPDQAYPTLTDFRAVQVDLINQDPTSSDGGVVFAQAYDGQDIWWGIADGFDYDAGSGWHTISADASTVFHWDEYQNQLAGQHVAGPFTGTIDQLESDVIHDDQGGVVGVGMGCQGGQFGFDAVSFGTGGSQVTYDLETTGTTVVLSNPPAALISAKEKLPFAGLLYDSDGTPYEVGDLTLEQKPFGSTAWTPLGVEHWSFDFTSHGSRVTARPFVTTRYRWVYSGKDASTSPVVKVLVAPSMTLTDRDGTVRRGDRIVLHGYVTPAKPGRRVTLHRGRHVVAHATVSRTGRFRFVVTATGRGLVWYHVTIRRSPGNLAGVPASAGVRVRPA